jgi:TolB protein
MSGAAARYAAVLGCIWGSLAALAVGLAQEAEKPPPSIPLIRVTGEKRQVPIAIPDFKNLGEDPDTRDLAAQLAQILRGDLTASGHFRVLDPKSYLVQPHEEGITGATVRFRDWFNVGAQLLIKVGFIVTADRLRLEAHLFEVDQGRGLWRPPVVHRGGVGDGRHMTHRIANAIIKYFTGEEGIFTTRVAYSRVARVRGEVAKNLWVIDYDGYGRRALTNNPGVNLFPRWSPDGNHIVFSTTVNAKWEIVRHSLASGSLTTLTSFPGIALGAAYSPDGKWIAASLSKDGNAEIYLLSPGGRVRRRLTHHWGIDTSPTWSPDGQRIAFVSDRHGTPQIFVMDKSGGDVRRLTFRGNYNQEPDWSPRGHELVFTARDEHAKFDLFTVDVKDGMQVARLTQDEGNNESARWAPDGRQIVFSSTRKGASRLYYMLTETRETRPVPNAGKGAYTPAWSPRPR